MTIMLGIEMFRCQVKRDVYPPLQERIDVGSLVVKLAAVIHNLG